MKKLVTQWLLVAVVILTAFGISACSQEPANEKIEPAVLEPLEDGRNLVILTEMAAQRLDIQIDAVREDQVVRSQYYGGEVMAAEDSPDKAMIRVSLRADELSMIDQSAPVRILPLGADDDEEDNDDESEGMLAELDEQLGFDDDEENGNLVGYYVVNNSHHGLINGQKLLVAFPVKVDPKPRLIVPIAAVVFDINGKTWVYTSSGPLTFLREPVTVDYYLEDMAVLSDGPPVGTKVAVVGVPELFGIDTGVGK